jgi:hypothetical protein
MRGDNRQGDWEVLLVTAEAKRKRGMSRVSRLCRLMCGSASGLPEAKLFAAGLRPHWDRRQENGA